MSWFLVKVSAGFRTSSSPNRAVGAGNASRYCRVGGQAFGRNVVAAGNAGPERVIVDPFQGSLDPDKLLSTQALGRLGHRLDLQGTHS